VGFVKQLEEKEERSKRCKGKSRNRCQFVTENGKEAMQLGMEGSRRIQMDRFAGCWSC